MDCVVFIYGSETDAREGSLSGATGFLVRADVKPDEGKGRRVDDPNGSWPAFIPFYYVVTNAHVIESRASVTLRVNLKDGGFDVLTVPASSWYRHPGGDDVAVTPLVLDKAIYKVTAVPFPMLLPTNHKLAPGDECFFVGRHVHLDGSARNTPAVRFGNISMVEVDPIPQPRRGHRQESIVVEARSLGGYSGSPVFAYTSSLIGHKDALGYFAEADDLMWGSDKYPLHGRPVVVPTDNRPGTGDVWLLGIDWGHMTAKSALEAPGFVDLPREDRELALNSGMMLVVPGWKITQTLNRQELVNMRQLAKERLEQEPGASVTIPSRQDNGDTGPTPLDPTGGLRGLLSTPSEREAETGNE